MMIIIIIIIVLFGSLNMWVCFYLWNIIVYWWGVRDPFGHSGVLGKSFPTQHTSSVTICWKNKTDLFVSKQSDRILVYIFSTMFDLCDCVLRYVSSPHLTQM